MTPKQINDAKNAAIFCLDLLTAEDRQEVFEWFNEVIVDITLSREGGINWKWDVRDQSFTTWQQAVDYCQTHNLLYVLKTKPQYCEVAKFMSEFADVAIRFNNDAGTWQWSVVAENGAWLDSFRAKRVAETWCQHNGLKVTEADDD